jgi:hypothetical protein
VGRQRTQTAALGCASTRPFKRGDIHIGTRADHERRALARESSPPQVETRRHRDLYAVGVLQKIIITISKSGCDLKPFDCVTACTVSSASLGLGIIVMMEAVTAFFGVISAGIFLAHAVDGYRSR